MHRSVPTALCLMSDVWYVWVRYQFSHTTFCTFCDFVSLAFEVRRTRAIVNARVAAANSRLFINVGVIMCRCGNQSLQTACRLRGTLSLSSLRRYRYPTEIGDRDTRARHWTITITNLNNCIRKAIDLQSSQQTAANQQIGTCVFL